MRVAHVAKLTKPMARDATMIDEALVRMPHLAGIELELLQGLRDVAKAQVARLNTM